MQVSQLQGAMAYRYLERGCAGTRQLIAACRLTYPRISSVSTSHGMMGSKLRIYLVSLSHMALRVPRARHVFQVVVGSVQVWMCGRSDAIPKGLFGVHTAYVAIQHTLDFRAASRR